VSAVNWLAPDASLRRTGLEADRSGVATAAVPTVTVYTTRERIADHYSDKAARPKRCRRMSWTFTAGIGALQPDGRTELNVQAGRDADPVR
jgi:hypothetical protein